MIEEVQERVRPMRWYASCYHIAGRAQAKVAWLDRGNVTWWDDIVEVLLGNNVRARDSEAVQRWLRDELQRFLIWELGTRYSRYLVEDACEAKPQLIWTLPISVCEAPARYHRRIVAILLPAKFRELVQEMKRHARFTHPDF